MAPWEGIKTDDGVARGGERALSFISKSISEAQRSAQLDMKLMKSRVQSFIHLSATIDKEWESLKKSSRSFNDATKGFDSTLQNFLVVSKGSGSSTSVGGLAMFSRNPNKPPSTTNTTMKVEVSRGVDKSMLVKKDSSQQEWKIMRKLNTRGDNESNWEPLQRVKRTVHRSLGEEIDTTTATATTTAISKSPPVEFLENVKKNLNDTMPLSMPELLEKFAGHAEPLLGQLGLKKDGSKVGDKLRSCKHKVDQLSSTITMKGKELGLVGKALAGDLFSKGLDDLDHRIGSVVQGTGYRNKGGLSVDLAPARQATVDSRRSIAIVTTSSLPWMTGTATFVRGWLENRVGFRPDFKIAFYPGKFSTEKRSILAAGNISQFIPDQEADVAVLEEPKHLTWYYHGKRWTDKFQHVVGIIHTNYLEYVKQEKNGKLQAFLLKHVNNWVVRIYCNKVLRLSAATQALPRSSVCNVHGVSPKFLDIGKQLANESENSKARFSKGAYYLGKMVWGKGYRELVDLLAQNKDVLDNTQLDVFYEGNHGMDSHENRCSA
ncbi:hypothetical protein BDL97_13G004400 [Sphagnum fallax]|nr:hypothetical protein BDL97_13G004400 [Sphagnum fallax]